MLRMKNPLLVVLTVIFFVGLFSMASADQTLSISPNSASNPDPNWDLKNADIENHQDSYVPWVDPNGQSQNETTMEEIENARASARVSDHKGTPISALNTFTDFLTEGFEGGVIPPTGWTTVVNNSFTWEIDDYSPYEGIYNATCLYDENYTGNQDEWLISPSIDLTGIGDAVLDFWWNGSYYWSVDPYPNCTLSVFVSTDGGSNWTYLWSHNDFGVFTSWEWNNTVLDLSAYVDETINLAFVYTGYDGAQFSFDAVSVNNNPLPTGRCCYGDPTAPDCDDLTQAECDGLGGSWDGTLNCTDNPCPVAGPGDNCDNPLTITLPADMPYTDAGQFTCSRGNDYAAADMCYGTWYGDGEDIVYEITVTEEVVIQVNMDPKGTSYTYVEIREDCPPTGGSSGACITYFRNSGSDAYSSEILTLPAGTYHMIIDTWPSPDCIPDFDISIVEGVYPTGRCCYGDPNAPSCADVTEAECGDLGGEWDGDLNCTDNPCQAVELGDNCSNPIEIKVPADLPYLDENYTCGRDNNYETTCLGYYDSGEDIIYLLDVDAATTVNIFLDPRGTTYTGIAVSDQCPLAEGTSDCLAKVTGSSGTTVKEIYNLALDPGLYYIQIDTWAAPDCIPDFELTIEVGGGEVENDSWDKCEEIGDVTDLEFSTAMASFDGPGGCQTAANLWYCYTPMIDGEGVASLCGSGYDTKLAVYDGIDPTTAPILECNDDFCGLQSEVHWDAIAGQTYLIEVGGYSSNVGSGLLSTYVIEDTCSAPNPHDNCSDVTPTVLTMGVTSTFTGANGCASNEAPTVFDDDGHVWEAFTITQDADVVIDYCGTTPAFELIYIILLDNCPPEAANTIFAESTDWDLCGDGNVTMFFPGLPAGTYYLPVLSDHPSYPTDYYLGPYTINVLATSANLTFDPDAVDFGLVAPGSTGGSTLTLGVDGSRDVNYEIDIIWGDKARNTNHANNSIKDTPIEKAPYTGPDAPAPDINVIRQGGDDIANAVPITSAPATLTGTTAGYTNDYDEVCPYSGSTAPDVVYSWTCTEDGKQIDIDMYSSAYDTKIYVYQDAAGNLVDCNDDYYSDYTSALFNVDVLNGSTYYIIIDGYGSASGDYTMYFDVHDAPPEFGCPESSIDESEACGGDTNGGCNMDTPAFEPINCGDTVCGTVWADGGTRDTDWYLLTIYQNGPITWTAQAEFPFVIGFVETAVLGDPDCASASALNPYATGNAGDIISVTLNNAVPGDYWLFVSHTDFYDYPCGTSNGYWATPECDAGTAPIIWLTASPMSGTVPAGGTLPVSLNYDVTELPNGVHTAQLLFTHDGNRAEDIVPVTIEVGNLGNNILMVEPNPVTAAMQYSVGDSAMAAFYLGGEFAGGGYVVEDIDMGSGMTVNGMEPVNYEFLETYPGFTGHVLKMECPLDEFIMTYPVMWDVVDRPYSVAGSMTGGGDFVEEAMITTIGHTSGDANADGVVNLIDITYSINYIYNGGPDPRPIIEVADCDASGSINILDVIRLISFLYKGGEAPAHP